MKWNDKRYHTLDYEFKKIFGEKTIKLSINGGFTCPNRDGTISSRGCLFCSEQGSGEFAGDVDKSINEQLTDQMEFMSKKWKSDTYIAYFQSYTNTYDDVEILRKKYYAALRYNKIKGLAIATRPDCLSDEIIELLKEINEKTFLWIELGLQTIHPQSAKLIRRGYELNVFDEAVKKLKENNIRFVVHLILGLPGETHEDMLDSVRYINNIKPWGVKLHLLHVLKNTDLCTYYEKKHFHILSQDEYIKLVCDCLEFLNEDIVIQRLTGDGKKQDLIEPRWSLNKLKVLSDIDRELVNRNSFQGSKLIK